MTIDQKLISDCVDGNRKAQNELYKLVYPYLMSICIRYTRNNDKARENLNIGFFRTLKYLSTYQISQPFKPWLRTVMINSLMKEYKKEKTHRLNLIYVEDYEDSEKYSEMNTIMQKINSEQIYRFIEMLSPATASVFNLYIVDGYKHREIAEMMDFSESTSKWHLNSAREKLKEMILTSENTKNLSAPKTLSYE